MSTPRSHLECVAALRSAHLALLAAQRARREAAAHIARARSLGATWADVGAALGVTRQTAHERFGAGGTSRRCPCGWRSRPNRPD